VGISKEVPMKPYSKEFRGEVLAACDRGRSTREVARRSQLPGRGSSTCRPPVRISTRSNVSPRSSSGSCRARQPGRSSLRGRSAVTCWTASLKPSAETASSTAATAPR